MAKNGLLPDQSLTSSNNDLREFSIIIIDLSLISYHDFVFNSICERDLGGMNDRSSVKKSKFDRKTSSTEKPHQLNTFYDCQSIIRNFIFKFGRKKSRNLFPLLPELNCKEWFAPWSIINFTQQRPQEIVRPNHGSVLEIINKIAVCLFVYWKVYQKNWW